MLARTLLAVCVLLTAPAQALSLEDAAGDHVLVVEGEGNPPPARFTHLDLLSLEMQETKESVRFTLGLAQLPAEQIVFVEEAVYTVLFMHNDQEFRIQLFRVYADQIYRWGNLQRFNAQDDDYNWVASLAVTEDTAAGTLSFEVLRDDLRDREGAAPFPGRELSQIRAFAYLRNADDFINLGVTETGMGFDVQDRMPDDGFAVQTLRFEMGLQNAGHAALWSDTPMRASNGEATTFVYTIKAQNTGEAADTFDLEVQGAPTNWHISVPQQSVELEAGEIKELPVIVSTPFSHQHGSAQTFRVTMESRSDPASIGRAELGIRYHAVPQPAGHHDEVWFHTTRYGEENPLFVLTDNLFSGNGGFTYFNTVEDFEEDQDVPVNGNWRGYGNHGSSDTFVSLWSWWVFLNPQLEMGLDFDLTDTGTVTLPFSTQTAIPQAKVYGYLNHYRYDEQRNEWEGTNLAELEPTEPFDFLPGETRQFTWDIVPTQDADLVPYNKRATLVFQMFLESPRPNLFTGAEAPSLAPGGSARLPLLEYRDPVQDQFAAHTYLHFAAPAASSANPGTTRILKGSIHNADPEPVDYSLTVEGVNAEWARILIPRTGTLESDGSLEIPLAVTVPSDAVSGDAADLVVSFAREDDPTVRAIGRYYVAVDTSKDLPDDSAQAVGETVSQESPALPTLLLVAALGALALATRTRARKR